MAMTRDGMNGPRMQLDGLEWLHGHFGLNGSRMHLHGTDRLHRHSNDYMAHTCNQIDYGLDGPTWP